MKANPIKVLLIEDDTGDTLLIRETLAGAGGAEFEIECINLLAKGLERLEQQDFDLLLLDLGLPDSNGYETFATATKKAPHVPIIVLTGLNDEETGLKAVSEGAQDYLVKGQMAGGLLVRSMRYAIERKRVERELKRINAELEVYAETVSHDLRGPLAAIMSASELLRTLIDFPASENVKPEVEELTKLIENNVKKSARLIRDLLVLAEAGQKPTEVQEINVKELVSGILAEKAELIKTNNAEVVVSEKLGLVKANKSHIYQLFSNLIDNAVKHNDSKNPLIEVKSLGRDNGRQRFLVRDNGQGIPIEDMGKIFMPFYKGKTGETGIGLATVSKIINVYNGSIRVYNNDGACFEFSLGIPNKE